MIDANQLLGLWPNLDEIPACDEGMELARRFLIECGRAVDFAGEQPTLELRSAFDFAYKRFIDHRLSCEKCNEV